MSQFMFGTGRLTAMPVGGGAPTPFGALQNVSVDFTGDVKELWGRNQFPLDTARGKVKIAGKAAAANVDPTLYNAVFFGQTVATGQQLVADGEAHAIAAGPITVTNTPFVANLGVVNAATGAQLIQDPSGTPLTGHYTVNAATGAYTFAAADIGVNVLITYSYGSPTTGQSIAIGNQLMGATPTFQIVANGLYKGKQVTLTLYACVSSKLTLPLKLDDYMIPEFDFSAYDNGAGQIGLLTATDS
jgi:hypothetical protein